MFFSPTSQDVTNETPNDVSIKRCQDVTVVRLHNALLERREERLISTSPRFLKQVSNETPNHVAVVRLHHVSELRCRDVLLMISNLFSNYFVITSIQQVPASHLTIKSSPNFFQYQPGGKKEEQFFFSIWVFIHENSQITGLQGKGEGIFLTPHYHFHPLHTHLDINGANTAENSPLHIASSQTGTGNH